MLLPPEPPVVGPYGWESSLTSSFYPIRRDVPRKQVLSYGGGKQTACLVALIIEGKLPRPDHIVMADTGREGTATWDYLHEYVQPALAQIGLRVEIASHSLAPVDLVTKHGKLLMPMATTQSGELGRLPTFCSSKWKKDVVRRYLRQQGVVHADLWIGYSMDESSRAKPMLTKTGKPQWARHVWPLLDLGLDRSDSERIAMRVFGKMPPKSSCYMCPWRGDSQWADLKENYPSDWQAAVKIDEQMRELDPHVFLHSSGLPLADVKLLPMADQGASCDTDGGCFT